MARFTNLNEMVRHHYGVPAAQLLTQIIDRLGLPHPKTDEVYVTREEGRFLVFLGGLGCVLSVRSSIHNVPDDPAILKPLQRFVDDESRINIELFPGVRSNTTREEFIELMKSLFDRGILWGDPKPDNAGRLNNETLVIDLDSLDFSPVDMKKARLRSPVAITPPTDAPRCNQDKVFRDLKSLLWRAWYPQTLPDASLIKDFWAATRAEVAQPKGILINPIDTMIRPKELAVASRYGQALLAAHLG
jgi:hypothetical protein